ncbi:hypothetical protein B0J14DRAFT_570536 [Halenospora varia]|nr:hypothetical protein B0J14DRAFT_570536 [Halenospora varia]
MGKANFWRTTLERLSDAPFYHGLSCLGKVEIPLSKGGPGKRRTIVGVRHKHRTHPTVHVYLLIFVLILGIGGTLPRLDFTVFFKLHRSQPPTVDWDKRDKGKKDSRN